jgi:class I fructose-bisphosphate aldolase
MGAGFTYRMGRLFDQRSGGSVIVPIDHGMALGATTGLEDPRAVLKRLIEAGIDGTLLNPGMARQVADLFAHRAAPARVLSADLPLHSNVPGAVEEIQAYDLIAGIDDALRLGVDAVKTMIVWGIDHALEMRMLERISALRQACNAWDMPLLIEPVLWGKAIPEAQRSDPTLIANACRICVELGADILKAPYIADEDALRALVERTPIPIVILGGKKVDRVRDVIQMVATARRAGVRGVVFGRNVWQHDDPSGIIRALRRVIHEGASVDEAMGSIDSRA